MNGDKKMSQYDYIQSEKLNQIYYSSVSVNIFTNPNLPNAQP